MMSVDRRGLWLFVISLLFSLDNMMLRTHKLLDLFIAFVKQYVLFLEMEEGRNLNKSLERGVCVVKVFYTSDF
jgi:hypothetical protein